MPRKTTRRAPAKTVAPVEPAPCPTCTGAGTVARTVRVGRRHRTVGRQEGLCLTCLGSGLDPNADA
ncbi:hypothetical protein [Streptomyces sp. NRRL F-5126]|uniref:hypothetical protein n=1 Tax=Streptomyces sp. NRRL F-5126 TaxID=1463857 RepID=UPI0004C9E70B|nr:hypothetical protein [Streptomyces sp. NRRL F-5126]